MKDYTIVDYQGLRELGVCWSRQHIARLERRDLFPKRVRLSPGSGRCARIGWYLEEVQYFLATRPRAKAESLEEQSDEGGQT